MGQRWVVVVMVENETDAIFHRQMFEECGFVARVQQEAD